MKPTTLAVYASLVLGAAVVMTGVPSAGAQTACLQGYVWREAFPGDHVCVTPETRTRAAQDNSQADARRQPGGGAYGPNTCVSGFVWREARPNDLVCVTPETRAQAASDNAQAASRRVASTPAVPRPSTGGLPGAAAYRVSNWSGWGRAEGGLEYRYRWGWNPHEARYATQVDALFEVRNPGSRAWEGAARSLHCTENTVAGSKRVVVPPGGSQEVKFLTANCGTKDRPSFRPNMVRSVRIDP